MRRIAEQLELSRELPVVVGNADYRMFRERLERIDELLRLSELEDVYVEKCLAAWDAEGRDAAQREGYVYEAPSGKECARFQRMCRQALRCNVARQLTEREYRKFSRRLADSPLLQWFCRIERVEAVKVPSKSALERYDKMAPESEVRELVNVLNLQAVTDQERLALAEGLSLDVYFSDTTCVKANIHFPTDWVLLRDGVRTLMKGVKLIRKHGLKHRMPAPDGFLSQINRLSMEMSQSRRRPDSVRRRKAILRRMKRLTKVVRDHAERYVRRLEQDWRQTDLSEGQMKRIRIRLQGVVEQLPEAIRQAHERIIGGRKVENRDKILSLYEPDIHVIVRKKADAEVEFGNTLLLAEQTDGLIVDWKLDQEISRGDVALLPPSVERVKAAIGRYPRAAGSDRGFDSQGNRRWLEERGIVNALCPRSPQELKVRMSDSTFRRIQKRRAQTEGRIAILKNDFLGRPLRSKGFDHREKAVAWAILVHNLWLLAGLPNTREMLKKAA
jgi:hypothetical protein